MVRALTYIWQTLVDNTMSSTATSDSEVEDIFYRLEK